MPEAHVSRSLLFQHQTEDKAPAATEENEATDGTMNEYDVALI